MNLMQFSVFLCADLEQLRLAVALSDDYLLHHYILGTESLLATFLQQRDPAHPPSTATKKRKATALDKSSGDEDDEEAHQNLVGSAGSRARDPKERDCALQRDGMVCVATKSVEPDVCHYWPFAINDTVAHRNHVRKVLGRNKLLFSEGMMIRLTTLFVPLNGELRASDKEWNMISMNTQLHQYWKKAYFGLKWLGVAAPPEEGIADQEEASKGEAAEEREDYASFRVQWHWLPDGVPNALQSHLTRKKGEKCDCQRLVDLDSTGADESISASLRGAALQQNVYSTKGAIARDEHGRLVESGHVLTLRVKTEDLDKAKAVIDAQCLAVQMAAFSGAGEEADDLDRKPPPSLPDQRVLPSFGDPW